jgi:hypothetical protein
MQGVFHIVQSGSGAHRAPYSMGTGGPKLQGCQDDQSPPSSAEIKKWWTYNSIPSHIFYSLALVFNYLSTQGTECNFHNTVQHQRAQNATSTTQSNTREHRMQFPQHSQTPETTNNLKGSDDSV